MRGNHARRSTTNRARAGGGAAATRGGARKERPGPRGPGAGGGSRGVSPRAAGATVHELSRVGLLATLSGETLTKLAAEMRREDVAAGAAVFQEGEPGDRFYVVLSGLFTV